MRSHLRNPIIKIQFTNPIFDKNKRTLDEECNQILKGKFQSFFGADLIIRYYIDRGFTE